VVDPGRAAAITAATAALLALPWLAYVRLAFPREVAWEAGYELRHVFEPLEGHAGTLMTHLAGMGRLFGEIVYVPVVWFLNRGLNDDRRPARVALAVWLVLPYVVFSLVATKMPGYVMTAAPAVFMITAAFVARLVSAADMRWRAVRLAVAALVVILPSATRSNASFRWRATIAAGLGRRSARPRSARRRRPLRDLRHPAPHRGDVLYALHRLRPCGRGRTKWAP